MRHRLAIPILLSGRSNWVIPTDIPAGEALALRQLYNLTNGKNWTNKTNWGTSASASTWYGIFLLNGHVQRVELQSNNLVGDISSWNLGDLPNCEDFILRSNASLTGSVASWNIPTTMENLQLNSTGVSGNISGWTLPSALINLSLNNSSVSGDISGWTIPADMQTFAIHHTSVSGDVADWVLPTSVLSTTFQINNTSLSGSISTWIIPAAMQFFYMGQTSLSGTPNMGSMVAIREIQAFSCGFNQATVNAWLAAIYARRAAITFNTPSLLIHGTNAAPSGTYADEDPPSTGNGYRYELVNDPETEGFKRWSITVTT